MLAGHLELAFTLLQLPPQPLHALLQILHPRPLLRHVPMENLCLLLELCELGVFLNNLPADPLQLPYQSFLAGDLLFECLDFGILLAYVFYFEAIFEEGGF